MASGSRRTGSRSLSRRIGRSRPHDGLKSRARSPHQTWPTSRSIEVPATHGGDGDTLAILLTGDGGWADIDKSLAAGLSAHGIPVVGWSSLGYYWTPRSPAGAAADLNRIIEHYTTAWRRSRVLIVGYSFGADVAPFLVNRLPESVQARVTAVTLLGPSATASFEFHVTNWLVGGGDARYPVRPEIERSSAPVTCVSATDEADSVCREIRAAHVRWRRSDEAITSAASTANWSI